VCLLLEQQLVQLVERFDQLSIDAVVLKGAAYSHRLYSHPEQRCFGDIDLLVRSESIDAAVAALSAFGARRLVAEVRPGFDRRFAKSVTMRLDAGWEIDLHRMLTPGYFGLKIPEAELWSARSQFSLWGTRVSVLSDLATTLHCAVHLTLGGAVRLASVRDMAEAVWRSHDIAQDTVEAANEWGLAAPLSAALQVVALVFRELPRQWQIAAPLLRWDRLDERALRSYERSGSDSAMGLRALSPLDAIRYAYALANPSADHLRDLAHTELGVSGRLNSALGSAQKKARRLSEWAHPRQKD
jgi:hypothetical protein